MPIDESKTLYEMMERFRPKEIVTDDWYFNPQSMELVPRKLIQYSDDRDVKRKGDAMSKRTEIKCRDLKDGMVEFVGYKNVMTLAEIDKEIGIEARTKLYAAGRCYYALPPYEFRGTTGKLTIAIWNKKESIHKEFHPGQKYSEVDWDFFIEFLIESGERYGEIKADLKASEVHTIVI